MKEAIWGDMLYRVCIGSVIEIEIEMEIELEYRWKGFMEWRGGEGRWSIKEFGK